MTDCLDLCEKDRSGDIEWFSPKQIAFDWCPFDDRAELGSVGTGVQAGEPAADNGVYLRILNSKQIIKIG